MKTLKLITVIGIALTIQSCNMSKHYANMRIEHEKETDDEIQKEHFAETKLTLEKPYSDAENKMKMNDSDLQENLITIHPTNTKENNTAYTKSISKADQEVNSTEIEIKLKRVSNLTKSHLKNTTDKSTKQKEKRKIDWGGVLTAIGYALIVIAFIFLVIFTWSSLAAFWLVLGTILLFILGICIGITLVVWSLIELFFETF